MARYVVRFGALRNLGVFQGRDRPAIPRGTRVVARTPRGTEAGEVLCPATDQVLTHMVRPPSGQILREMTAEDDGEAALLKGFRDRDYDICRHVFRASGVPMQLVDTERLLGREKVVVYFLAEGRVDFRHIVRALSLELGSRIEMWQIQVRDEAKLLADVGDCGKEVCCATHLAAMPKVTMKMAKLQRATLDPTKISGRCGRLKCCLRYEFETYESLAKTLPRVGAAVAVRDQGNGRVLSTEILGQQVLVQTDDGRRIMAAVADVQPLTFPPRPPGPADPGPRPPRARRPDRPPRAGDDASPHEPPSGETPDE